MSASITRLIDGAIGETREALVRDGRVIALNIVRARDEGRRARWGELYAGRVRAVEPRLRGAFVDLGLSEDIGFLPLTSRVQVSEGARITVSVVREGARAKGPVLKLESTPAPEGPPHRIARPECDEDVRDAKSADRHARMRIDEAIEEALARETPLAGGGKITIEPTAALVAIDVDASARAGTRDPERFALDLNCVAAGEIALQLRLRNLGGLVAIDFVSMRAEASRAALLEAVKRAFVDDSWSVQVGRISRFGVLELARAQLRTPVHEMLLDRSGAHSTETLAWSVLRAIEREAAAQGGRRIAARCAPEIVDWLNAAPLDWRAALDARIGARWAIEAAPLPRERFDVGAV